MNVNGQAQSHDVEPRTLLVQHIRENVGLTGTNIGCDTSSCGACTVHLDGQSVKSCTVLAVQAEGAAITTIEGLDSHAGKALQAAWVEEQVPQCGYCQSGQLMQAADLLANNPSPSDEDIVDAMNGNLCRCMAYTRIKKAIKSAANGGEV